LIPLLGILNLEKANCEEDKLILVRPGFSISAEGEPVKLDEFEENLEDEELTEYEPYS
jgi:hypothetical protein